MKYILTLLVLTIGIAGPLSAEQFELTFSLHDWGGNDNTIGSDPIDCAPCQKHRGADLLSPSGLGDELWGIAPGPGPDIDLKSSLLLGLPLAISETCELDAISAIHPDPDGEFFLAFSVDPFNTFGNGLGGQYNITDQKNKNHVSSDIFYALPKMVLGQLLPNPENFHIHISGKGSTHPLNPAWPGNQVDLDLPPRIRADENWNDLLYDDIDALEFRKFIENGALTEKPYFSVDPQTAALMPEANFGSDILVKGLNGISVWAEWWQIGLTYGDNIDALVIFDENGILDESDYILFSLSFGSTTLQENGYSAADVLITGLNQIPQVFAPAEMLGLLETDELNALAPVFNWQPYQDMASDVQPYGQTLSLTAFPNPFNPQTALEFKLDKSGFTQLDIYDIAGSHVINLLNQVSNSGYQKISWSGKDSSGKELNSGAYFARLTVDGVSINKKLLLIK
jgi:hypothetical protein